MPLFEGDLMRMDDDPGVYEVVYVNGDLARTVYHDANGETYAYTYVNDKLWRGSISWRLPNGTMAIAVGYRNGSWTTNTGLIGGPDENRTIYRAMAEAYNAILNHQSKSEES